MKNKQLVSLLFLIILINYTISNDCSDRFQSDLQSSCENHSINTTHGCAYLNGLCISTFRTCSSYTGEDKTKCESIILSDKSNKCIIRSNKCTEVKKICEEYDSSGDISCSSLYAGESQRCILINDVCQAHYEKCEDFTEGVDGTKCKANIPLEINNKCIWDNANNVCKEVRKECKDYFSTHYSNCEALSTSDQNKICISSSKGDFCEEKYKTCELYNSNTSNKKKEDCEGIKTYSDTNKRFDNTKVCEFSGTTCSTRDRKCEDLPEGYDCRDFTPLNSNTICVSSEGKCKTQYKTCELYDLYVSEKSKTDCESIKYYYNYYFDDNYKCVFNDGTCTQTKRDCSEFTFIYF